MGMVLVMVMAKAVLNSASLNKAHFLWPPARASTLWAICSRCKGGPHERHGLIHVRVQMRGQNNIFSKP